jgi:hypothetical protein
MSYAAEVELRGLPEGSVRIVYGKVRGLPPWFPERFRREIEKAYREGLPVRCAGCAWYHACRNAASDGEEGCRAEMEARGHAR